MSEEDQNLRRIRMWLKGVESVSPQLTESVALGKELSPSSVGDGHTCNLCQKLNDEGGCVPLQRYSSKEDMLKHAESHAGPLKLSVFNVMKCCFEDDASNGSVSPAEKSATDVFEVAVGELLAKHCDAETIDCSVCDTRFTLTHVDVKGHVYGHWDVDRPLLRCGACGLCDNDLTDHVRNVHPGEHVAFTDYKENDEKLQKELADLLWKCFSPKLTLPPARKKAAEISSVEKLRASAAKIATNTRNIVNKQRKEMNSSSSSNLDSGEDTHTQTHDDGSQDESPVNYDDVMTDAVLGPGCTDDDVKELVEDLVPKIRAHIEAYLSKCQQNNKPVHCQLCQFSSDMSSDWMVLYEHMWTHCKLALYACRHCDFNGITIMQHCQTKHPRKRPLFNCHIPDHVESIIQLVRLSFDDDKAESIADVNVKNDTPKTQEKKKVVSQKKQVEWLSCKPLPSESLRPLFHTLCEQAVQKKKLIVCSKCGYKPASQKSKPQKLRHDRLESHVYYHLELKPFLCGLCDWTCTSLEGKVAEHFAKKHDGVELKYRDTRQEQKDLIHRLYIECFFDNQFDASALKSTTVNKRRNEEPIKSSAPPNKKQKNEKPAPLPDVAVTEDDYQEMDEFLVEGPPILEACARSSSDCIPQPVLMRLASPSKQRNQITGTRSRPSLTLVRPGPCEFLKSLYDHTVEDNVREILNWRCANCSSKLIFFQGGKKPSYCQVENHLLHHTRLPAYCCDICRLYRGNDIIGHFKSVHPDRQLSYRDLRYDFQAELTASFYQCFAAYVQRR